MDHLKKLSIVLPPALLAILEFFHASGHMNAVYEVLAPQIDRWLVVHFLQLILFPLTAWSVYALSQYIEQRSPAEKRSLAFSKTIAIAMAIYGIGFASFDSIAGIGTGILIKDSLEMIEIFKSTPDAPADFEPIVNEMVQSYYHAPSVRLIFHISKFAAILGFALTAQNLHRYGYGWFPVIMLAGACYGVTKTHAPPYGPITYGLIFAAALFAVYWKNKPSPNTA